MAPLIIGGLGLGAIIVGIVLKGILSEPYYLIIVELGVAGIIVALAETFVLKSATKEMGKLVDRRVTATGTFLSYLNNFAR